MRNYFVIFYESAKSGERIRKRPEALRLRPSCAAFLNFAARLFHCLFDRDCDGDGGSDHRVVAHADEAHHVDVRGD